MSNQRWSPPARRESRRDVNAPALLVLVVAVGIFATAFVAAKSPKSAVQIVAAMVLIACALVYPKVVLILAPFSAIFSQRVGPAAINLSVADAVCVLAFIAALRFVPWGDRRLRIVLLAVAGYLGFLMISLAAHHDQRAIFEWFHRGALYGGSIIIGVAIVHAGVVKQALRVFIVGSASVGVVAILYLVSHGFEPAEVLGLNKNHVGLIFACSFIVLFAARPQLEWSRLVVVIFEIEAILALMASQSRGAAIGVVVAVAIRPLLQHRRGRSRTASLLVLVGAAILLAFSLISLDSRDLSRTDQSAQFNSINSRTNVYNFVLTNVWGQNRFVGAGLRYYMNPANLTVPAHDIVIGEMGEAGLSGLVGLVGLLAATFYALRKSRSQLAMMSAMVFVVRLTQGFVDLYWVAGPLTIALILTGMGLTDGRPDDIDPRQYNPSGQLRGNPAAGAV
jgi:O-antigen ligase